MVGRIQEHIALKKIADECGTVVVQQLQWLLVRGDLDFGFKFNRHNGTGDAAGDSLQLQVARCKFTRLAQANVQPTNSQITTYNYGHTQA